MGEAGGHSAQGSEPEGDGEGRRGLPAVRAAVGRLKKARLPVIFVEVFGLLGVEE